MEEIKNEEEIITVRKEKYEGTKTFDTYVFNKDGKAVKLSFRQDSNNISVIPYGISKIRVKRLSQDNRSFYPKYYASFIEIA